MISQKLAACVDECLVRLDRGEDLLETLADYPRFQEQLEPLLLIAMASRTFPPPLPGSTIQRLGKNRLLAEMNDLRSKGAFRKNPAIPLPTQIFSYLAGYFRARGLTRLAPVYRLAGVALLVMLSGGVLTLNASASSQPGDVLYTLKLSLERTIAFTDLSSQTQQEPFQGQDPGRGGDLESGDDLLLVDIPLLRSGRSIQTSTGIIIPAQEDNPPGIAAASAADLTPGESALAEGFGADQAAELAGGQILSTPAEDDNADDAGQDGGRDKGQSQIQEKDKGQSQTQEKDKGQSQAQEKEKDKVKDKEKAKQKSENRD